jgi:beta-lactamase regulating signal transducer with metallopeptidase domain
MTADLLFDALLRCQVAASLAVVLVLALRAPSRLLIGAELTYRLWVIVPVTAVVSLFPTLSEFVSAGPGAPPPHHPHAALLLQAWFAGAIAAAGLMALGEALFRRSARRGLAGPAVMGVAWPRIVTPADYAERFTASERELIGRHERAHIARRDPKTNLFIAAMRALGWFNPLVQLAGSCARLDQELACDAAVIQAWPACRRDYGATLLKAHLTSPRSALACAWPATGPHPLEVRLSMLSQPPLSLSHYLKGAAGVGLVAVVVAVSVWSLAP